MRLILPEIPISQSSAIYFFQSSNFFDVKSVPFPASVARFMNFQCQLQLGVLKRREMKKKGTRNWEAAGSDSRFLLKVG